MPGSNEQWSVVGWIESGLLVSEGVMDDVAPDGRGYGYSWHRAISDLLVVNGWT